MRPVLYQCRCGHRWEVDCASDGVWQRPPAAETECPSCSEPGEPIPVRSEEISVRLDEPIREGTHGPNLIRV